MFEDAIDEFWAWWDEVADELAAAITDDVETDIPDDLTDAVWRIHPDLDWQIVPGTGRPHSLNLVSGGSRILRLVAEAWVRKATPSDRWRFHPARLPFRPDPFLVRGLEVDPADVRFTVTPDHRFRRLDVTVGHPAFATMGDDEARDVGLYLLDAALGEDGAERWIGLLDTTDDTAGPHGFEELAGVVDRGAGEWSGDGWEDVSDQYDGVVVARVDRSVKWIDHLDKLVYGEVTIQSLSNDDDGVPQPLEARRLDTITTDLLDRLGAAAILLGTATGDGERSLHLFLRSGDRVVEALETWVADHGNRRIDHDLSTDEQWAYAEQWD